MNIMTEDNDPQSARDSMDYEEFSKLGKNAKIEKLNMFVQRSQVYSRIMAETIREATNKKAEVSTEDNEAMSTRKRSRKNDNSKRDIVNMLSKPSAQASVRPQPSIMKGELKDYQLDGMEWLITLYENGLNGILADEMGLGKTIQCIAFLSFLVENGISGPFLVVSPLSTVSNWMNEFQKFSPKLNCLTYVGSKEKRGLISFKSKFNVLVTSYEIVMKDYSKFSHVNWKYMVIDEGHRLKNINCALISTLKKLNVSNKLLITGTPLQNDLLELWSLLNFILPDIFHDVDLFQQWFDFSEIVNISKDSSKHDSEMDVIELKAKQQLIKNLHTILKPFILRRVKAEVDTNLPPKKEYLIHITMSPLQNKLYKDALNNSLFNGILESYIEEYFFCNKVKGFSASEVKKLYKAEQAEGITSERTRPDSLKDISSDLDDEEEHDEKTEKHKKTHSSSKPKKKDISSEIVSFEKIYSAFYKEIRHLTLQNTVMQLRNICNSPYIYYDPIDYNKTNESIFFENLLINSSKFSVVEQLLQRLLKQKHKVLIFSQFTKVLDLLSDLLDYKGIEFCRLDGSTAQEIRESEIKSFNSLGGKNSVFLLSTRAGGLGINLVAADTVIIFDNDWNPQVDLQAIDRVHRIGQTKPVKVFRFIVRNSVEEILISRSYSKRFLEKLIISMGEFRFRNFRKVIKDQNFDVKNLIELSRKFQINGDIDNKTEKEEAWSVTNKNKPTLLSDEELAELLDRSKECFQKDVQLQNITSFETLNNLDKQDM